MLWWDHDEVASCFTGSGFVNILLQCKLFESCKDSSILPTRNECESCFVFIMCVTFLSFSWEELPGILHNSDFFNPGHCWQRDNRYLMKNRRLTLSDTYGISIISMMIAIWRSSVFHSTRRLLMLRSGCCKLKVGKIRCMKLGKRMVRVGKWMHHWLLKWRIVSTSAGHQIGLKVPASQLIHT